MKKEEIVNLIMNGGKTAKGKGRENLQEWGMEMIKEYAKQKCNQQRKICAESGFDTTDGQYTFEDIANAPEPEFD